MSAYLPENVERLVADGLETCQAEDRLLALGLANQEDALRGHQSHFGSEVAGIFMRQLGLVLEPDGERKRVETWTRETAQAARIMLQIDKALGGEIGTHSRFYKFVKYTDDDTGDVIVNSFDGDSRWPETGFTVEEPFFVIQRHYTDKSRDNFNTAMSAVLGMSGVRERPTDPPFSAAFERLREQGEL